MNLLELTGLKRFEIQLARRGEWEDSFSVGGKDKQTINDWVAAAGKDVAIESLFCDAAGELKGFIGFRRCLEEENDRLNFWTDVIAKAKQMTAQDPREHAAAWLAHLDQPSRLESAPDKFEMGVWNQWISAGSVLLHSDRLTESALRSGPDWLRQGATAPICLERQWAVPDEFWIATVVSRKERGRHFLDSALLLE